MSLARVHSPLSQLIIRQLGDGGGPRGDQVAAELDSLIAWARSSPRCIHRSSTVTGNIGAGLDTLHTFSLPAGSLATDGDYLSVWYGGDFTANDTDKRIQASFGGTAYDNSGALDVDGSLGWNIQARIIRLSSTSVRVNNVTTFNVIFGDSTNAMTTFNLSGLIICRSTDITGLADLGANATTMQVQGEAAANDDITQNLSIIELTQQ